MAIVLFDGLARKVMLPLTALSAVGWLVYVIGFGILRTNYPGTSPLEYPFWAAAVIGPFVYISAVAHAALRRQISSIVGSVTAFLSIIYFTAMGYILHSMGIIIYTGGSDGLNSYPSDVSHMFAGSFIACLFWAGVLAMWPWYKTSAPTHQQLQ